MLQMKLNTFLHLMVMSDVVLCTVLEQYFVTLDNYKLDDSPIKDIDMTENNWTTGKCVLLCNHLENCQTVTVKKDKTRCQLFSVSVFGIGSTPVSDNNWQTLGTPGKLSYNWVPYFELNIHFTQIIKWQKLIQSKDTSELRNPTPLQFRFLQIISNIDVKILRNYEFYFDDSQGRMRGEIESTWSEIIFNI